MLVFTIVTAAQATEANVPLQVKLRPGPSDPDMDLDVTFTDPRGRDLRVPAFLAGDGSWNVRYSSPLPGTHRFKTSLPGAEGSVEIRPYAGANPLYARGPIRVAAGNRRLEHADGTPFFWLGDTWWMGLCARLGWPDEFARLAADRRAKGFTVVQIVAGLYPDMPPFDPRGANEAGFPWEKDYARIRPEYFDAADARIRHLAEQGLAPLIVGAWGYFLPWMGADKAKRHWRELVARYGAYPVVWCVAGEANLPWYLAKGFPYDDREQVRGWTEVARYLRAVDPFRRLITIHPTGLGPLNARGAVMDASLLDFDMLQTPHGGREAVAPAVRAMVRAYAIEPAMPVVNGEASYEMLWDKTPAQWPRAMFWISMMNGAAGHTYGANGIWQCNRKGRPHGASPHGSSYGVIAWDEAMDLPGSRQVGMAKKFLEELGWNRLAPQPGAASWAAKSGEPGPWVLGSADELRAVYAIAARPIVLTGLRPGAEYEVTRFDPVAGEREQTFRTRPAASGECPLEPPAHGHDWLAVFRLR